MEKLSELQQLILVALLEPRYGALKRRQFNLALKALYYGKDSAAIRCALSRSLRRLEERGAIRGHKGGWQLTEMNTDAVRILADRISGVALPPSDTPLDLADGFGLALLVWAKRKTLYARIGLNGPPPQAIGFKPKTEQKDRPGVKVDMNE